jgi:hypothetical protein
VSDHIPDVMKMLDETPCNATPREELRNQIMSSVIPKNEREWWANRTIEQLERELNAANAIIRQQQLLDEENLRLQERIKRLEHGIAKQNLEIEQTCGKVLDYPWFRDDQKNFPGATEKDGVCVGEHVAETIAAELARKYTEAKERIKRLEEAGNRAIENSYYPDRVKVWNEAKEAKP